MKLLKEEIQREREYQEEIARYIKPKGLRDQIMHTFNQSICYNDCRCYEISAMARVPIMYGLDSLQGPHLSLLLHSFLSYIEINLLELQ